MKENSSLATAYPTMEHDIRLPIMTGITTFIEFSIYSKAYAANTLKTTSIVFKRKFPDYKALSLNINSSGLNELTIIQING